MKFEEYTYSRPDWPLLKNQLQSLASAMKEAGDYCAFKSAFDKLDDLLAHYQTMASIAEVRHTINTKDAFYDAESEYFNETSPLVSKEIDEIYHIILESPFCQDLRKDIPEVWFQGVEYAMKSFSPEIVEDLQEENKLMNEYQKVIASAEIEFDGKTYTLASLDEKMNDQDRQVRKRANKAYWQWMADHEKEIGDIYDRLVKVRDRMAKKLGFENYIPLAYLRMNRFDYDQKDVEQYRKNILEDVVPVCNELYKKQIQRLGNGNTLPVWDEKVEFLSGNAKPVHTPGQMVEDALKMYTELDPAAGEFFAFMKDRDLMDLEAKPNKAAGGYCTFFPDFNSPFIFSNFNKTQGDVETLTHEAGHAFQAYYASGIRPRDCICATMESAEIHSMSMEFFTWPWMHLFFDHDTDKYYYTHLAGSVKFLPYGVLVDHFQHEVYANPNWSPEQRMDCWRRLEKQYLPHKDYEEIDFLERGGWWMRQLHIFLDPFYYIDYTLAQVCALQFWKRTQDKDPQAFEDYKLLCSKGGTLPFRQLVQTANLEVPFEPGCLKQTMNACRQWFDDHPVEDKVQR